MSSSPHKAGIDARRHCTLICNVLLLIPLRLAKTFAVWPAAVEPTLTLPFPWVKVRAEVLSLFHVTEAVMSCVVLLPEYVPFAVNVMVAIARS